MFFQSTTKSKPSQKSMSCYYYCSSYCSVHSITFTMTPFHPMYFHESTPSNVWMEWSHGMSTQNLKLEIISTLIEINAPHYFYCCSYCSVHPNIILASQHHIPLSYCTWTCFLHGLADTVQSYMGHQNIIIIKKIIIQMSIKWPTIP